RGEWTEVMLFGWEIHGEATRGHAPKVEKLAAEAMAELYQDDGPAAERLLKRALEIEPDAPDLLNNLARAYQLQGRMDESDALTRQIQERFPDYFFGRVNKAMEYTYAG